MLDAFAKRVEEELQKLPINDVASLERAAAAANTSLR
jgi:hypothetical protein